MLKTAKAIRGFCLNCQGGSARHVEACSDTDCALHPWRHVPDEQDGQKKSCEPLRAIRRHCMACAGSRAEVRACDAKTACKLWPFRFGVLPATYRRVWNYFHAPRELWLPGMKK